VTFQDVVEADEERREFVSNTLASVWPGPWQRLSLPARIAFIAMSQGMRLLLDRGESGIVTPYGSNPRLVCDPAFAYLARKPVCVPASVTVEMIESGLMSKVPFPRKHDGNDANWWAMTQ
jgi:hypothetical protein